MTQRSRLLTLGIQRVIPVLSLGVALLVLMGWSLKNSLLVQLAPTLAPMQCNTALGFVTLAFATWCLGHGRWRGLAVGGATLALVLATVSTLQYPLHADLGIDTLFVTPFVTTLTSHPGRMSPNTGLAFILSSLALLGGLLTRRAWLLLLAGAAVLGSLTVALAGLLGYALHLETMQGWSDFTRMALHTALLHTALALAIVVDVQARLAAVWPSQSRVQTLGILGVGGVLSGMLFVALQTAEAQQLQTSVQREARLRQAILQSTLDASLRVLYATERFFAASTAVERVEFGTFVTPLLAHDPAILSFDWAPRILEQDRLALEQELSPLTGAGFTMLGNNNAVRPHTGAAVYFPVQYTAGQGTPSQVLGFDHYSDLRRAGVMDRAARTGTPQSTDALQFFRLDAVERRREDILVFVPAYGGGDAPQALPGGAASARQVRGFVVGLFRLSRVATQALAAFSDDEFQLIVSADRRWSGTQEQAEVPPPVLLTLGSGVAVPEALSHRTVAFVQIAGSTLPIAFVPTVAFLMRQPSFHPTLGLLLALTTTLLGASYFARQQRQQETLHRSQALLEALVNHMPAVVSVKSVEGRYLLANTQFAHLHQTTSAQLIGKTAFDLIPRERAERLQASDTQILQSRQATHLEEEVQRADGRHTYLVLKFPLLDTRGEPYALCAMYTDITARQQLAEELAAAMDRLTVQNGLLAEARDDALQATRAKSAFLASMSHEIRTPMNAILGMADLLEETSLTPTQADYVQRFQRAGAALLTLINDILDLSKIEADQLELEQIPFDLDALLQTVAELLAVRAQAQGVELLCSVAPDVRTPRLGDPNRLRQILVNLLSNALKFTATGEVALRVTQDSAGADPGRLRFSVRDTGIGIPAEKLATIFESFTQVDTSTTRRYGGTGLGLSISTKLAALMGGQLWAESQLGQGSTFHLTVSCALDPTPPPSGQLVPACLTDLRVLVVDDNATNCLIVREMLQGWGARVTEASGAAAALRVWTSATQAAAPFHLALLDCQMPGQDGFALAAQLTPIAGQRPATLIMLTSDPRTGDLARCQALGIAKLVPKPITRLLLARTLTEAFGQRAVELLPPRPAPPGAAPTRGLAILLAEDNEDNQLLIQHYLQHTAHHLTLVENGAVALERFIAGHYDLVLMDMHMPVMDGYTATARMRQWEQAYHRAPTQIVALTADALREDIQQSLGAGCDRHLSKPLTKAALLAALADATDHLVSATTPVGV